MADQWMIRGVEYGNCNCDYGDLRLLASEHESP